MKRCQLWYLNACIESLAAHWLQILANSAMGWCWGALEFRFHTARDWGDARVSQSHLLRLSDLLRCFLRSSASQRGGKRHVFSLTAISEWVGEATDPPWRWNSESGWVIQLLHLRLQNIVWHLPAFCHQSVSARIPAFWGETRWC